MKTVSRKSKRLHPNYSHPIDAALVSVGVDINNQRARTITGLLISSCMAIIPVACYVAGHSDLGRVFHGDMTGATFSTSIIVIAFLGGLWFSANKVASFIGKAFGGMAIGWGASLLIELSMTFTSSTVLSCACLAALVFFNVLSAASTLAKR